MKNPEIHLIVLWANARYKENEIIEDVKSHLDIMAAYDVHWSCDCVSDNFSRFYGVNLPNRSEKEKECGTTGFLLLVVRDNKPKYEMVETSRGHERVNVNIFSLKQKYRQWTRGGHKIHTTNSVNETNHDSALLLGLNYDDLKKSLPKKWDGKVKTVHRDITGAHGWDSLKQFFYTLNATTDYIVLRGFENLEQTLNSSEHGDIDIMVQNYDAARWIVGGQAHFTDRPRPHYLIKVKDKGIYIDLWDINNNYHDKKWDNNIFKTFEYYGNVIRVPNTENYFYMLIYHCLINKQKIASDYYDKIADLFKKLKLDKKYDVKKYASPFDLYFQLLTGFMNKNNYNFTRPDDTSVYYSEKLVKFNEYKKYLESNFGFKNVQTVYTDSVNAAYNVFASGYDTDGTRMFIKISDIPGIYVNEYQMGKILYDMDKVHFIRPMYYRDCPNEHFVAYEWTEGENLHEFLKTHKLSDKQRNIWLDDIYQIFKCLKDSDVVHRDITLKNLVLSGGRVKLIDFQLAVRKSNYKELDFLIKTKGFLYGLGTPEFREKPYRWDDAYSLCKVLECIGTNKSCETKYNNIYNEIKSYIGQKVISCEYLSNTKIKRNLKYTIFGIPIYRHYVSNNNYLKVDLFGIRVFKYKLK